MENQDDIKKELEQLSPLLRGLKEKGTGFSVPENYFQQLPDQILEQLKPSTQERVTARPIWLENFQQFMLSLFQPRFALALASVLILVVAIIFINPGSNEEVAMSIDLTEEEISAYIADNIEEFNIDMLIEGGEIDLGVISPTNTLSNPEEEDLDEYLDEIIDDLDLEELEDMF